MSSVLQLLVAGECLNTAQMSQVLNLSETEVEAELKHLSDTGTLGWRAILNPDAVQESCVRAVIEVRLSRRDGGFDRIAGASAALMLLSPVHLMSGSYDLLLFAKGDDLQTVASFVSEQHVAWGVFVNGNAFLQLIKSRVAIWEIQGPMAISLRSVRE